ncbi:MAG: GIY-YIG nuclease family protein [Acidobacteriia bacterium]|nr:GIY-YIG nuclease family protein [Terriglobia bacterium]
MALIRTYGRMWARNLKNIQLVAKQDGDGVYILYDGSMPVYIGMGNIPWRLRKASRSKRRGQMWDHFSWYIPCDPKLIRDIEALLLKMLPPHLRILNRQKGKLHAAEKVHEVDQKPDIITRKMPTKRKS